MELIKLLTGVEIYAIFVVLPNKKICMYIVSTQMYINFNEKVFERYYRHQIQPPNTTKKKHKWYTRKFSNMYLSHFNLTPMPLCLSLWLIIDISHVANFHFIHRTIVNFWSQLFCHYFLCIEFYLLFAGLALGIAFHFVYNLDKISVC